MPKAKQSRIIRAHNAQKAQVARSKRQADLVHKKTGRKTLGKRVYVSGIFPEVVARQDHLLDNFRMGAVKPATRKKVKRVKRGPLQ